MFGWSIEQEQVHGFEAHESVGNRAFSTLQTALEAEPIHFQAPSPSPRLGMERGKREDLLTFIANYTIHAFLNLTVNLGPRSEPITVPTETKCLLGNIPCVLRNSQPALGSVTRKLVQGLHTQRIVNLHNGMPTAMLDAAVLDRARTSDTKQAKQRPNMYCGSNAGNVIPEPPNVTKSTLASYFNVSCFSLPAPGLFGNLGRGRL